MKKEQVIRMIEQIEDDKEIVGFRIEYLDGVDNNINVISYES